MADVRANIGANTQGAEGALKRVLDMLRNLRRESESFRGDIQITQPEEVAKLTRALQDALKTAREFSRVDFSRFNADLGRSVQQLQKNVQLYLQAQKSLNPAVQQRFTQFLAGGGNPLAPNFNQLFPTLQGPALQRQMEFYFKSVLRGTGMPMPQLHAGGGAAGGSPTGVRDAGGDPETTRLRRQSAREEHRYWMQFRRTMGGMAGQGANFLTQTSGLGSFGGFGTLAVTGGILGVAAHGFNLARETAELKDRLFRQTEDTGVALDKLTENLDRAGDAFGQSTREVLQTAQTWARAAYQSDVRAIEQGYTGAAGFARAHGLDPGQTAATFGSLRHYGLGSGDKGEQQKFAMLIGQVIRDSGLKSAPDQVVNELREIAAQMARTTGRGLSATETDAYLRFRTSVSQDPILKGAEGMAAIESLDAAFRGTGGLPQEVFWAEALSGAGVTDLVRQSIVRSRGIFTDLGASDVGGQGSALDAVMRHSRMRYGSLDPSTRNLALSQITGMSPDLSGKLYEAYYSQAEPGALGRTISRLEGRGFKFSDMREDALSQILDAETATAGALRDMMERYASDMASNPNKRPDAESDAQRLREAISGGDATQMRDLYQDIVAKHGMQSTPASEWREASKGLESALTSLGETIMPLVTEVASLAKDVPKLTEAIRQWVDNPVQNVADGARRSLGLATHAEVSAEDRAQREVRQNTDDTTDRLVLVAQRKGYVDANGETTSAADADPAIRDRLKAMGPVVVLKRLQRAQQRESVTGATTPAAGSVSPPAASPTTATGAPTPPPATTTGGAATGSPTPGTPEWGAYLRALEQEYGIPRGILTGTEFAETGHLSDNQARNEAMSRAGAIGRFQFMPDTAKRFGIDPKDPHAAARAAARYHAANQKLLRSKGYEPTIENLAAAYNAGEGNFLKHGGIPPFPETQEYATKVAAKAESVAAAGQQAGGFGVETKSVGASGAFKADGLNIEYRGNPGFHYAKAATASAEPFKGIVVHHTGSRGAEADIDAMVRYGQTVDKARGGAFGYHFYVDRDGKIVQGAPLDKRTNHIKPGSPTGLTNSNAIGISLVGVEDGVPATKAQMEAVTRLGRGLQQQFGMDPGMAFGHGELQRDRQASEGKEVAGHLRDPNAPDPRDVIRRTADRSPATPTITGAPPAPAVPVNTNPATVPAPIAPVDINPPEQNYVPDTLAQAANARETRDRFGELTLHIDQRVNGETRSRQTQRLRAGSGVDIPRMHGSVALVS